MSSVRAWDTISYPSIVAGDRRIREKRRASRRERSLHGQDSLIPPRCNCSELGLGSGGRRSCPGFRYRDSDWRGDATPAAPPPSSPMWAAREGATAIFASMTNFGLYPSPGQTVVVERSVVRTRRYLTSAPRTFHHAERGDPLIITVIIVRLLSDFATKACGVDQHSPLGARAPVSVAHPFVLYQLGRPLTPRLETHASEITA